MFIDVYRCKPEETRESRVNIHLVCFNFFQFRSNFNNLGQLTDFSKAIKYQSSQKFAELFLRHFCMWLPLSVERSRVTSPSFDKIIRQSDSLISVCKCLSCQSIWSNGPQLHIRFYYFFSRQVAVDGCSKWEHQITEAFVPTCMWTVFSLTQLSCDKLVILLQMQMVFTFPNKSLFAYCFSSDKFHH